jgi:hypothetical protein
VGCGCDLRNNLHHKRSESLTWIKKYIIVQKEYPVGLWVEMHLVQQQHRLGKEIYIVKIRIRNHLNISESNTKQPPCIDELY